jgi:hypothetical protein
VAVLRVPAEEEDRCDRERRRSGGRYGPAALFRSHSEVGHGIPLPLEGNPSSRSSLEREHRTDETAAAAATTDVSRGVVCGQRTRRREQRRRQPTQPRRGLRPSSWAGVIRPRLVRLIVSALRCLRTPLGELARAPLSHNPLAVALAGDVLVAAHGAALRNRSADIASPFRPILALWHRCGHGDGRSC